MKTFAAVACLLAVSEAIVLRERSAEPNVIQLETIRRRVLDPSAPLLHRRAKTVTEVLDDEINLFASNSTLGTPPQKIRFQIDTGSSDLWANSQNARLCQKGACESGSYDANSSSTYNYVNSLFNISYADGTGAEGDYATDTFEIGGKKLEDLQFGIGYVSSSDTGILGIGYTSNEAQVVRSGGEVYDNVPALMVKKGLINSNAYSLWLNDLFAARGSVLFGGVDTEKFQGQLETLPILSSPDELSPSEFFIALTSMSAGGSDIGSFNPVPVLLDSGSSLSYLPDKILNALAPSVGVVFARDGTPLIPCGSSGSTVEFTFSQPTIKVDIDELVLSQGISQDGTPTTLEDGTPLCQFGIQSDEGSTSILGDTFLRSAYVVYDLANNEISLAPTNFNATKSNVVEIGTGKNSVPSATGIANPVNANPTRTGNGRIGAPTASASGIPRTKSAATATGVSFGFLSSLAAVAAAAAFFTL